MTEERIYEGGTISVEELNSEIDRLWTELQTPGSDLRAEAEEEGIDLTNVVDRSRSEAITVREEGMGLDPVTVSLVVAFAPLINKVVGDIWDKLILPRILRRKKAGALKPKR